MKPKTKGGPNRPLHEATSELVELLLSTRLVSLTPKQQKLVDAVAALTHASVDELSMNVCGDVVFDRRDGGEDVYESGVPVPKFVCRLSKSGVDSLLGVPDCSRYSESKGVCGCCPTCLEAKAKSEFFSWAPGKVTWIERDLSDLAGGHGFLRELRRRQWRAENSTEEGHNARAGKHRGRANRLQERLKKPSESEKALGDHLEEMKGIGYHCWRKPESELIPLPHWAISLGLPKPLHRIFTVKEGWLWHREVMPMGGTPKRVLQGLQVMTEKGPNCTLVEVYRDLLKRLLVARLTKLFEKELGLEPSLQLYTHAHGLSQQCIGPDFHILLCGLAQKAGSDEKVSLWCTRADAQRAIRDVWIDVIHTFCEMVPWLIWRWSCGCSEKAFKHWRKNVREECEVVIQHGLAARCVDAELRWSKEVLKSVRYMARRLMGRVESLAYHLDRNEVEVGYHGDGKKMATLKPWQFLERLVIEDRRQHSLKRVRMGVYAEKDREAAIRQFMGVPDTTGRVRLLALKNIGIREDIAEVWRRASIGQFRKWLRDLRSS